jgi:hypothetical protein
MKKLTLYEIMGDDHSIFARVKNGEVQTEVWNELEEVVFDETSNVHAWNGLVSFARMILKQDERIQKDLFDL